MDSNVSTPCEEDGRQIEHRLRRADDGKKVEMYLETLGKSLVRPRRQEVESGEKIRVSDPGSVVSIDESQLRHKGIPISADRKDAS